MSVKTFKSITLMQSKVNKNLKDFGRVKISGEIIKMNKFSPNPTFSMYFIDLVDKTGKQDCSMMGYVFNDDIETGDKIECEGILKLSKNGRFAMDIKSYVLIGDGDISKNLQKSLAKLKKEGLTEIQKQHPVYRNYKKIGIVTSKNAAGFRDVIDTLRKRMIYGHIVIYHCTVQGDSAPSSIISALNLAKKHNWADIILVTRGGGSKTDLECFNDYKLSQTIATLDISVATAIGHKIDKPLVDFVAAKHFITPTAAAEGLTINKNEVNNLLKSIRNSLINLLKQKLNLKKETLQKYEEKLNNNKKYIIKAFKQQILSQKRSLMQLTTTKLNFHRTILKNIEFTMKNSSFIKEKQKELNYFVQQLENLKNEKCNKRRSRLIFLKERLSKYDIIYNTGVFDKKGNRISTLKQLKKLKSKKIELKFPDGSIFAILE